MTEVEVIALSGGVGGARLALGLQTALAPGKLACIGNTGDDFEHLGLAISPDLDTLLYTLAGLHNPQTGWGRRDETWTFMSVLERLGEPAWFRLGDGDLALHVTRTRRLAAGETLTEITADVARHLGIRQWILPMSDLPVRTIVHTADGALAFQEYFVGRQARPILQRLEYRGAGSAVPTPQVLQALASERLRAIVVCPSNPYLSIDPILAVTGLRSALRARGVPIVAVCPLIGGQAVKGPTAKIMQELAVPQTPAAIVAHYAGLLDGLIIDRLDSEWADACGIPTLVTQTLMTAPEVSGRLAAETLDFASRLPLPWSGRR